MDRKSPRVNRPRLVCLECRNRKLKCDKARPKCTRCKQNLLTCSYANDGNSPGGSKLYVDKAFPHSSEFLGTQQSESSSTNETRVPSYSNSPIENIGDCTLHLTKPEHLLVRYKYKTFLSPPFAPIAIVQHDPYSQVLCGSLHGLTLLDLSNHLTGQNNIVSFQQLQTPLPFLEKAISRHIENARLIDSRSSLSSLTMCSLEDERAAMVVQALTDSVDALMLSTSDYDHALKTFYERIYPLYPFMDISIFENDLQTLFVQGTSTFLKINPAGGDLRKKMETLSLVLIFLSMGLKCSLLSKSISVTKYELARRLSVLSYQTIETLGVFQFPNERGFTCLLYFFISRYIDPESTDPVPTNSNLLNLRQFLELALTLGLQHDPSNYMRFEDPHLVASRRALWRGVQSVAFLISLVEGATDLKDCHLMQMFSSEQKHTTFSPEGPQSLMAHLQEELFETYENKYHFHIQLSKLVSISVSQTGGAQLSQILKEINRSEEFLLLAFPLDVTHLQPAKHVISDLKFERGAMVDVGLLKKAEHFLCNVVGRTCILNVYNLLSLHFEDIFDSNWEVNETRYKNFTVRSFHSYLGLASILSDCLTGRLGEMRQFFRYAMDKHISFALIRIWMFQSRFLVRLCCKQEAVQKQAQSSSDKNSEYTEFSSIIARLIKKIRNQMAVMIDLAEIELRDFVHCSFEAVSIFKYIIYVVDEQKLTRVLYEFWQQALNGAHIPQSVREQVHLKWGVDPNNCRNILHKLKAPHTLRYFDYELIAQLDSVVLSSDFGEYAESVSGADKDSHILTETNQEDLFNQILSSNSEAFWQYLIDDDGPGGFLQ